MSQVHYGHVVHVAGRPTVSEPPPPWSTFPTLPWRSTIADESYSAGTDFGGSDEWLILRVLGDAFKVHITEPGDDGVSMHPAEMLFTGTFAGARALDMEDRFGNFDVGNEADFVVVDPSRTPALAGPVTYGVRSASPERAREQRFSRC